jgi:hypothetical protein
MALAKDMMDIRCQLDLVLILLGLLVLLLNRLSCGASAALGNLLLRSAGVLDGPFSRLVLELGRVTDKHAGDFGVLRVFGLGCAEEGLEGDEGGLDGQDGGPL